MTENTKRGARGLIVPAATVIENPGEDTLLPDTVAERKRLGISPKEVALDGGFNVGPTRQALDDLEPDRVFISGRQQPGPRRTQQRMRRCRTGAEERISHLKRGYGLDRSRLKGEGQQIWTGWAILAYNADTVAVRGETLPPNSIRTHSSTNRLRPQPARPLRFRPGHELSVFPREVAS